MTDTPTPPAAQLPQQRRTGVTLLIVMLLVALLWTVSRYVSPAPPRTVVMSTGAPDGAYHQFGIKYQAILKENGITLELQPSSGSVENLKRLDEGTVDIGLVQGGLGGLALDPLKDEADLSLRALATVAFEPVWIFSTQLDLSAGLAVLAGKRIAIGLPNSGSAKTALALLATYGVVDAQGRPAPGTTLLSESGAAAAKHLQNGDADAAIIVAAEEAAAVSSLLQDRNVTLASLNQAEGLSRRFPFLHPLSLKQGSVNPQFNLPPRDVTLLATRANLVVQDNLHPALAYLLLEAARQTHNRPSLLSRPGDFPSSQGADFPLAEEADRYFKNGRPFLQRYLPFWLANFVQRLLLVLVPLFAVLFPAFRLMPVLITWQQEKKLFRHYGELKFIEHELASRTLDQAESDAAVARLNLMERDVAGTRFRLDFTDRVFTLRQHIDFVRARLNDEARAPQAH